ncbi:MAG: sulfatase [Deltaproteobacteria bacterium]|nr:sulfatase [Deltaproteobacteria bacterium]
MFLVCLVLVLVGGAYALKATRSVGSSAKPNLILISLDTLRADRLGTYKYPRDTSPFLDRWSQDAVVFEHAVSVAPWTLPSHVSMFTGLYPSSHGVTRAKKGSIGADTQLLTEILKKDGYQTFAFTAGGYVSERYGFGRGFDSFLVNKGEHLGEARGFPYTVKLAQEKLKTSDPTKPYFLFLHTYAVHCPYDPPAPYDRMFVSPGAERIDAVSCARFFGEDPVSPGNALYLSDLYDGSVRFLDLQLEKLFAGLKESGHLDNTIVVITSDHGEEFLEHGRIGHKKSVHKELLMIPLIVGGPGIKGQRIPDTVSNVDLLPTILELLHLPIPAEIDGHSLVAMMRGAQEDYSRPPYQLSELDHGSVLRSLMEPVSEQFIVDLKSHESELYDLKNDPGSQKNIALAMPDRIAEWKGILDRLIKGLHARAAGTLEPASKEQIQQLKTLGYL